MGQKSTTDKNSYSMNIQIIGRNITNFYKNISQKGEDNCIQNFWDFKLNQTDNLEDAIKQYFSLLTEMKNDEDTTKEIKECLLVQLGNENANRKEINLILKEMDSLEETYNMPLVLLLFQNEFNSKNLEKMIEQYPFKDPRLFFYNEFTDEPNRILEYIFPILLRFCSIHNELGDRFIIGEGDKAKSYDLIQNYFPFNINIACIGRFRQGKSTGVNAILNEYKAKESSRGNSQTKKLTFYHVNSKAIKVLDIPGFEDTETVKKAVEIFQECGKEINHIRDNLHIILYFLNFTNDGQFMEMESPMIEEISKHKNAKLIYVMTHSPSYYNQQKTLKIKQIKQGIQKLVQNKTEDLKKLTLPGGMLYPNENNVVFVNFYDDILSNNKAFGKRELFLKIYDSFIQTEEYKEFYRKKEIDEVKNEAEKLKKKARNDLFKYKLYGSFIGLVPFVDLLVQKYVIKKKIIIKLANMFGFQPTFFDDKSEEKPKTPIYITKSIEKDKLPTNLDKNQIEENKIKKIKLQLG